MGALLAFGHGLLCLLSLARHSLWKNNPGREVAMMIMIVTTIYSFLAANLLK